MIPELYISTWEYLQLWIVVAFPQNWSFKLVIVLINKGFVNFQPKYCYVVVLVLHYM